MNYDWPVYYSWSFLLACVFLAILWLSQATKLLKAPRGSGLSSVGVAGLACASTLVCLGSLAAFPTASGGVAFWFLAVAYGFHSRPRFAWTFVALAVVGAGLMAPFFIATPGETVSDGLTFAMGLGFLGMLGLTPVAAVISALALWFSQPSRLTR